MPFAQLGYPHVPGSKEMFERSLPGPVHLRGDRPDPRLVLHADGGRHAGLRPVLVRERRLPRAHPGRGRPQDEQTPGQHPAADPVDGHARRRRGALVHGLLRLAVVARRIGPRPARGDRPQDAADLLEHRVVLRPVRRTHRLGAAAGRQPRRRATGAGPLDAVARCTPSSAAVDEGWRTTTPRAPAGCSPTSSTTCRTGTSGGRGGVSGRATRRARHPVRVPRHPHPADWRRSFRSSPSEVWQQVVPADAGRPRSRCTWRPGPHPTPH